ncbi:hypothetical protein BH11PSE12_BH11PSE12_18860 [soil metagenome]
MKMTISLAYINATVVAGCLLLTPPGICAQAGQAPMVVVSNANAGQISLIYPPDKINDFVQLPLPPLPYPLHEKIWFSPDYQFAYLSSPQGWLIKLALATHQIQQQVRVGQLTSGIALSHDGRFLMVANMQPMTLVAIDTGNFSVIRTFEVKDKNGAASGVAAIHTASARKSFIAVMADIPELWELSYDDHAEPIYEAWVHDYKMGEGLAVRGPFPPRRIICEKQLSHVIFDANFIHAIGADSEGQMQVINLNIRRKIRDLHLSSAVQPDAGAIWQWQQHPVLVVPHSTEAKLSLIDMQAWNILGEIKLEDKARKLTEHTHSDYAWVSDNDSAATQATAYANKPNHIQMIDKKTLRLLAQVPAPLNNSSVPLAWSFDGRFVLLRSNIEKNPWRIVDSKTLEPVQPIPPE